MAPPSSPLPEQEQLIKRLADRVRELESMLDDLCAYYEMNDHTVRSRRIACTTCWERPDNCKCPDVFSKNSFADDPQADDEEYELEEYEGTHI